MDCKRTMYGSDSISPLSQISHGSHATRSGNLFDPKFIDSCETIYNDSSEENFSKFKDTVSSSSRRKSYDLSLTERLSKVTLSKIVPSASFIGYIGHKGVRGNNIGFSKFDTLIFEQNNTRVYVKLFDSFYCRKLQPSFDIIENPTQLSHLGIVSLDPITWLYGQPDPNSNPKNVIMRDETFENQHQLEQYFSNTDSNLSNHFNLETLAPVDFRAQHLTSHGPIQSGQSESPQNHNSQQLSGESVVSSTEPTVLLQQNYETLPREPQSKTQALADREVQLAANQSHADQATLGHTESLDHLNVELRELRQSNESHNRTIQDQQHEIDEMSKNLTSKINESLTLQQNYETLSRELQSKTQALADLEVQLATHQSHADQATLSHTESLDHLNAQLRELRQRNESLNRTIQAQQQELTDKTNNLTSKINESLSLQQGTETLTRELNDKTQALDDLKDQLAKTQSDADQTIRSYTQSLDHLNAELGELRQRNESLNQTVQDNQQENKTQSDELQTKTQALADLEDQLAKTQSDADQKALSHTTSLALLNAEVLASRQTNESLNQTVQEQLQEIDAMSKNLTSNKDEIEHLKQQCGELKQQVNHLNQHKSDYTKELELKIQNFELSIKEKDLELNKLIESNSKKIAEKEQESTDLKSQLDRAFDEKVALDQQIAMDQNSIKELQNTIVMAKEEFDSNLTAMTEQSNQYEKLIAQKNTQIEGLELSISNLDSTIQSLNESLENATAQLSKKLEEDATHQQVLEDKRIQIDSVKSNLMAIVTNSDSHDQIINNLLNAIRSLNDNDLDQDTISEITSIIQTIRPDNVSRIQNDVETSGFESIVTSIMAIYDRQLMSLAITNHQNQSYASEYNKLAEVNRELHNQLNDLKKLLKLKIEESAQHLQRIDEIKQSNTEAQLSSQQAYENLLNQKELDHTTKFEEKNLEYRSLTLKLNQQHFEELKKKEQEFQEEKQRLNNTHTTEIADLNRKKTEDIENAQKMFELTQTEFVEAHNTLLKTQEKTYQEEIEQKVTENSLLKTQLQTIENEKMKLTQELFTLRSQSRQLLDASNHKDKLLKKEASNEMIALASKEQQLMKIEDLLTKYLQLSQNNDVLIKDKSQLSSDIEQSNHRNNLLQTTLEEEREDFKSICATNVEIDNLLRAENDSLKAETTTLQNQNIALQAELNNKTTISDDLLSTYNSLSEKNRLLEEEVRRLNQLVQTSASVSPSKHNGSVHIAIERSTELAPNFIPYPEEVIDFFTIENTQMFYDTLWHKIHHGNINSDTLFFHFNLERKSTKLTFFNSLIKEKCNSNELFYLLKKESEHFKGDFDIPQLTPAKTFSDLPKSVSHGDLENYMWGYLNTTKHQSDHLPIFERICQSLLIFEMNQVVSFIALNILDEAQSQTLYKRAFSALQLDKLSHKLAIKTYLTKTYTDLHSIAKRRRGNSYGDYGATPCDVRVPIQKLMESVPDLTHDTIALVCQAIRDHITVIYNQFIDDPAYLQSFSQFYELENSAGRVIDLVPLSMIEKKPTGHR